jgi:CRP-like cAMP-binding protein
MTQPTVETSPGVIDALRKSELFSSLSESALREVAARSTLRSVRRGEKVWSHGSPSSTIAIVAQGRVKCWSPGHDQRQWVSSVVRPGGTCGLAACVDGGPYSCNAEPMERSRVVLVPQSSLRAAMERDPVFARRIAVTLAREVRRTLSSCEDVALRTPLQRLAHYLTTQVAVAGVVELRETQTQIAAQLGTVREVVGRGFRFLEAQGIVARTGRMVRLLRPRELAELAASDS